MLPLEAWKMDLNTVCLSAGNGFRHVSEQRRGGGREVVGVFEHSNVGVIETLHLILRFPSTISLAENLVENLIELLGRPRI